MRLIDADELISKLHYRGLTEDEKCWNYALRKIVKEQPIAYDVEKVVEQLEEKAELAYRRYMDCPPNSPCFSRYRMQYEERKMCLEIVKGGGVNEI